MDVVTYEVTFYREVEGQDELDVDSVTVQSVVPKDDVRSCDRDSLETVIALARAQSSKDDAWIASQLMWHESSGAIGIALVPDNM